MGFPDANIERQNMVPFFVDFGNDVSILLRIKYIGAQASGIVDIASTGDITFSHGVSGSEAVDSDTELDAGAVGVIDVSADIGGTYKGLVDRINRSTNWRAWLVGALPDAAPNTTTTGHFTECTGADGGTGDCDVDGGYAVTSDDSDSKYICAGMTFQAQPGTIHNTDHQVVHEVHRVIALSTFASGTSSLLVYACDDYAGTKEQIKSFVTGATTVEVAYPTEVSVLAGMPLTRSVGKRLVVQLINSAAMSVVRLKVEGWSFVIGPGVDKSKLYSNF